MPGEKYDAESMFATTQNRVIAALVAVVVVLLVAIAFLVGRGSTTKTVGETSTHVSPSPAAVASPNAVVSPSPVSDLGKPVVGDNAELKKGVSFDPAAGRGNGGPCDVWLDAGWTHSDCGLIFVGSQTTPGKAVAYMVEKKATR